MARLGRGSANLPPGIYQYYYLVMSFTVYILLSLKIPKTYVGFTDNLDQRLKYHNSGRVQATKYFRPWKLLYQEIFNSAREAKKRELYWKSAAGRRNIKRIMKGFPPKFRKFRRGSPR